MKTIKRHCEEPRSGDAAIQVNNGSICFAYRSRLLRRAFVLLAMTILFSAPAVAKVCMSTNPTIVATQEQMISIQQQLTNLQTQVDNLGKFSVVIALENCTFDTISPTSDSSSSPVWSIAQSSDPNCKVTGEMKCSTDNGALGVAGTPSDTEGRYCWCKMTIPKDGAWVFLGSMMSSAGSCKPRCAYYCANGVLSNSVFRAAVLAIP